MSSTRSGVGSFFPVAQGDCGPDATALSLGLPSTPSSWKSIRVGVAESMRVLRSTEWFRQCFKACQEFSPDPVIADPECLDDFSSDGSESANGGDGGDDAAAADAVELETDRKSVRSAISYVSGVPLGERSVPATMLDTYIKRMSAEELAELKEAYARGPPRKPSVPCSTSTLLAVRRAVGVAYLDFTGGA